MSRSTGLTSHDEKVLNAVFNPHTPLEQRSQVLPAGFEDALEAEVKVSAELKNLELEAVNDAQDRKYEQSLNKFNEVISKAPHYASAYNNRAQLHRVMENNDLAIKDLKKAIEASNGRGFAASQAYMQRGLIKLARKLETEAETDLKQASALGNQFAKNLLIELNPYAAMCNRMLAEMFERVKETGQ